MNVVSIRRTGERTVPFDRRRAFISIQMIEHPSAPMTIRDKARLRFPIDLRIITGFPGCR
jgi:hypothetical protein